VPKLKGLKLKAVKKKLSAAHCKLGKVKRKYSQHVRKGRVLSQKPKAGSLLANQAPVRVTLSRGPRPRTHR
jgi:serine/threonine-protein kinase